MSKSLVSDALWALIAPLLPVERPECKGGRTRIAERAALTERPDGIPLSGERLHDYK